MEITSSKVINFYNNNPQYDINKVNEWFIDLIENMEITNSLTEDKEVNFIRSYISSIDSKLSKLSNGHNETNEMVRLMQSSIHEQRQIYIDKLQNLFHEHNDKTNINQDFFSLVKETNENYLNRIIGQIETRLPEENRLAVENIRTMLTHKIDGDVRQMIETNSPQTIISSIEKYIIQNLSAIMEDNTHLKHIQSIHTQIDNLSRNINEIVEIQKNSTLKGKYSEEKLEQLLISTFPSANIRNCSSDSKTCDFALERSETEPIIYIENKDYSRNVPNEEIRKFIRDIEYQYNLLPQGNIHGILLSQNTGIQNKNDFQIDLHMGNILIYLHNVEYDSIKIKTAINIIDHLSRCLESINKNSIDGEIISNEMLSEINQEYLKMIENKRIIIDNYRKFSKEHIQQIETIEMNKLSTILHMKFSNIEHTIYRCDICGTYETRNKRSLTSHKVSCKKKHSKKNELDL